MTLIFVVVAVSFAALQVLAFSLPHEPIRRHAAQSIPQLEVEGTSYKPFLDIVSYRLDNYTDAIMVSVAVSNPEMSAVESALACYRAPAGSATEGDGPLASLRNAAAGNWDGATAYARYWHGYQVVLRPALLFFSYPAIRYLNLLVFAASLGALLYLIMRRLGSAVAVVLVVSLLWVSLLIIPMSLQFSGVFYLAIAGSILVMFVGHRWSSVRLDLEMFLVLGMAVSFVDLLTAPILTLGIPLILLLLLRARVDGTFGVRAGLLQVVRACFAWAVGYGAFWAAKWLVASAVLGWNVFADALGAAAHRTGGAVTNGVDAGLGAFKANLAMLVPLFGLKSDLTGLQIDVVVATMAVPAAVILVALGVAVRFHKPQKHMVQLVPVLAVGMLPYVWFAVMENHSAQHFWFTYRAQAVALFALGAFLVSTVDSERLVSRLNEMRWVARVISLFQGAKV